MKLIALLLLLLPLLGAQPGPKHVVFVCEHGTVKSLVAIEYFNKLARERGLNVQAISRGTKPDSLVPLSVARGLTSDGFDVSAFHSRQFTSADLAGGMLVVALDADVSPVVNQALPVVRWDGLPSVTADYSEARTAIVRYVSRLVDSLASVRGRKP
jgi:arsenate reductase (thioredoxin)